MSIRGELTKKKMDFTHRTYTGIVAGWAMKPEPYVCTVENRFVREDKTKQEWNDEVFKHSMGDTATNDPSETGDNVFASISVKEVDINSCQPVNLKED